MLGVQKKRSIRKTAARKTVVRKPAAKKTAAKKAPVRKVAAKKTVARKTVAKKTVAARKPVAKRVASTKKSSVAVKAGVCMKKHKHTAACGRVAASGVKVCASAAKRKTNPNRSRTAHSWRQQLMKLVAR